MSIYDDEEENYHFYDEETHYGQDQAAITSVPTLEYYQRTYAGSMGNEDRKAVQAFKQFESQEKLRRLQNELMTIKSNMVREATLNRVVGPKRRGKWTSYERWASLMLQWLASAKS